jgi:WD40 repeat protein
VVGFASTATAAQHARQVADRQRDAAVAGRLVAQSQSLGDSDPVLARLESAAAWQIDPSAQARDAMLDADALPGIAVLNSHAGEVYCVAFSPDGKTMAVGSGTAAASGDGVVDLWDVAARRLVGVIRAGDGGGVSALAFSPDGKTLVTGTWDGTVTLWAVATLRQAGAPLIRGAPVASGSGTGVADVIKSLAFSHGGKTIAAARSDGTVRLWDVATGRQVSAPVTGAGGDTIFSVAFSPVGNTLGIGSLGVTTATVRLWDTAAGRQTGSFPVGEGLTSVAFSPDGRTLVTGSYQGTVRFFDVATRSQLGRPLTGVSGQISSLAFTPDGRTLATGSYDGTARLWSMAAITGAITGIRPASPAGRTGKATYAALNPDGKILAVGDSTGTVRLFGADTGRELGTPLRAGAGVVTSVAFSRDDRTLATATVPGGIRLWNLVTRRADAMVTGTGEKYIVSVAFSPDNMTLAAAGATSGLAGTAQTFDVTTSRPTGHPLAGGNAYLATAFSPDGSTLATGSAGGVVRLWDLATGQQAGSALSVGPDAAVSLAFSPDGQTLAVGASDGTALLFDAATGRPIGSPLALGVPLSASTLSLGFPWFWLGFGPHGKILYAATPTGAIVRWDASYTVDPVASACAAAGRSLTRAEWARYVPGLPYQGICS